MNAIFLVFLVCSNGHVFIIDSRKKFFIYLFIF